MRTKKGTKTAQSIRYVLSADSRLRRLSLRKMSARVKKTTRQTRANRIKTSAATTWVPFRWGTGARVVVVGTVFLLAAAALITARQPSSRADVGSVVPQPTIDVPPVHAASLTAAKKPVVPKKPNRDAAAKPSGSPGKAPAAASVVSNEVPVIITGCLQRDDETFWLKDTSGVDAPKSRGWRSGFLTKRPSRVTLVAVTSTLKLQAYVGQRVEATGVMMKREMRAHSLRRVTGSCH